MFVPFLTKRSPKGGGGGHSGGKGGGSHSPGSSGKSSGKISGTKTKYSTGSKGGAAPTFIEKDHPWAGRTVGGGTREQIYGTRVYGSGYPGYSGPGVAGRNFPFGFIPLVFILAAGTLAGEYAFIATEYGLPNSSDRIGGALAIASFRSKSAYYYMYADQETITSSVEDVNKKCKDHLVQPDFTVVSIQGNGAPPNSSYPTPNPAEAVQFFRSSSVALLLVGYNNTAFYSNYSTDDTPLPKNYDLDLLSCLNSTIAAIIPITDKPPRFSQGETAGICLGSIAALLVLLYCAYFCEDVWKKLIGCVRRRRARKSDLLWSEKICLVPLASPGKDGRTSFNH
ncbi:hypothetical protein DXG01_016241 [Tephrocybe rancida]|nr:hypothetical protein DXG01_016241 [Tephrocybe rancida]